MPTSPTEMTPGAAQPRRAMPGQAQLAAAPPSGLPGTVVAQQGRATLVAPPEPPGGVRISVMGREAGRFMGEEMTYVPAGGIQPITAYQRQVELDRPTVETWHRQQVAEIQQKAAVAAAGAPPIQPPTTRGTTLVPPPEPPGGIPIRAGGREVGRLLGEERAYMPTAPGLIGGPGRESEMAAFKGEIVETTKHLKEYKEQTKTLVERFQEFLRPGRGGPAGEPRAFVQGMLEREWQTQRAAYARAGWRDPYAGAWGEMQQMALAGREQAGVAPEAWKSWTIRGQLAGMRERLGAMAPTNRRESLQSAVFAMYAARRGWQMTAGQLGAWAGQYGQYDLAQQQAQFAMGGEVPTMGGAFQQQQVAGARMANLQASLGRSAWENFGFLSGAVGMGGVQPTPLTSGATLGLGLVAPWAASKLGAGALSMAGAPTAAGFMSGVVAPAMATGAAVLGGVAVGGGVARALGADVEPGLGGTLGALSRYGRQGLFLGGRALAGGLRQLGIGPQDEEQWAQHQRWMVEDVLGLGAQQAKEQSPLDMLSQQQQAQLRAQATAVIGQAPSTGLMESLAGRAQLMGFKGPEQYLTQLQQLAIRGGAMPGGAGMPGMLQQLAGAGRTELLQAERAAGVYAQGMGMYGAMPGGGLVGFAGQYAGMSPAERRELQQVMAGNRYRWSDIGRAQGRNELITMEEGGLPIFTTEMRGLEDETRAQQRDYRDWRSQQQYEQMQENQQYIRAGWTIQDQQRQLRAAQTDWQYGYQQRAFAMQGAQWTENFMVQGRQQQQAMALGRQMFETRVGFQQQDIGRAQERQQQQFEWRMEDWTYQENRAQLSYGWQMEDLSEAVRYSTGRQRRQLMKQQERGTISESMRRAHHEEQRERMEEQQQWQEEDYERQRERNEELIRLQREQFEMRKRHWEEDREISLRHHEEDREMQEERMTVNREYYELGKELDDERIQVQRGHQEAQMEFQIAAWEKQKEFNATIDETQDRYRDLQRQQQDVIAGFQRALTYTEELAGAFLEFMGEAKSEVSTWQAPAIHTPSFHPVHGMQAGGFVRRTERAMLHEGEHVVPAEGALVIRGDNPESIAKFEEMIRLLGIMAAAAESGKSSVVIVETNNAKMAQDHALSLADEGWGIMPGT